MAKQKELRQLISKWTAESDGFKAEARRLERSDLSRHATSVAMLEAHAQAIERCILEVQAFGEPDGNLRPIQRQVAKIFIAYCLGLNCSSARNQSMTSLPGGLPRSTQS